MNITSYNCASIKNGLAFVGLLHHYFPDRIKNPDQLDPNDEKTNRELAWTLADKIGIINYYELEDFETSRTIETKTMKLHVLEYYNNLVNLEEPSKKISDLIPESPVAQVTTPVEPAATGQDASKEDVPTAETVEETRTEVSQQQPVIVVDREPEISKDDEESSHSEIIITKPIVSLPSIAPIVASQPKDDLGVPPIVLYLSILLVVLMFLFKLLFGF